MPFFTLDSPSIGLSLLKAALVSDGVDCELKYFNLELGKQIGADVYSFIAGSVPVHLLFGDLIFAPSVHGTAIDPERVRSLLPRPGTPGRMELPEELVEVFPDLVRAAAELIDAVIASVDFGRYDLVGLGTMFTIAPALALAKRIKALPNPPPIVIGGSYCEDEMGESLVRCFPFIDFACRGEGERLIVELARHLRAEGSGSPEDIAGLVWRDAHGTVHANGESAALHPGKATLHSLGIDKRRAATATPHATHALDALAKPKYDDWIAQVADSGLVAPERRRLPIQTSRGCWYGEKHHCTFCGLNDATIAYRRKSPERALEEFRELFDYGVRMVHAVDDIMDFRYLKSVLPALAELNPGTEIFYEIKANLSLSDVELLKNAGIVWIQPGIESLSTPVLKLMDKGTTALQNLRLLRYAAELGVGVAWNLLYGFPSEDPREFDRMAELIPALSHLQPPFIRCTQIRLHRFSPLFVQRDRVGLKDVVPTAAHYELYPFDPHVVEKLAYYFDHGYAEQPEPNSYITKLAAAVRAWHEEVGTAAFFSLPRGEVRWLFDTRGVATAERTPLEGTARALFEACEHGATLAELLRCVSAPEQEVLSLLESFVQRRWVAAIDGQYLALAVPMDRRAPASSAMPLPLLERSLREASQGLMRRIRQGDGGRLSAASLARLRTRRRHEDGVADPQRAD
jgi:ribosomal peptide maturation radical SAM protein 1